MFLNQLTDLEQTHSLHSLLINLCFLYTYFKPWGPKVSENNLKSLFETRRTELFPSTLDNLLIHKAYIQITFLVKYVSSWTCSQTFKPFAYMLFVKVS